MSVTPLHTSLHANLSSAPTAHHARTQPLPNGHAPVPSTSPSAAAAASSSSTAAAAAASSPNLPGPDAFAAFSDVQPGTLPLLVRMPDGACEQVDVPLNATVDDIKHSLSLPAASLDDLRLSFGNSQLHPSASLLDTNIVPAYEHAGSLLQLIGSGIQDMNTKAAALDTACAVVESISNGIKDMEALCQIAVNADNMPQSPSHDPSTHPSDHSPNPDTPPTIDPSGEVPNSAATPSQLAHGLSRRLPNLFPPAAAAAAFPGSTPQQSVLQPHQSPADIPAAPPDPQPSISSIRDARRRLRAAASSSSLPPTDPVPMQGASSIGTSTFVQPHPTFDPPDDPKPPIPHPSHFSDAPNIVLASSGKTTWLGDVMKTWEVGAVRQSGVLDKTKDGQEINDYLISLEEEAHREHEQLPNPSHETDVHDEDNDVDDPGESSDDDHDPQLESPQPGAPDQLPHSSQPNHHTNPLSDDSDVDMSTEPEPHASTPPITPQTIQSHIMPQAPVRAPLVPPTTTGMVDPTTGKPVIQGFPPQFVQSPSASSATPSPMSAPRRRATKIAPAPTVGGSPLPIAVGNGVFPAPVFQGCPPLSGTWPKPSEPPKGKKKRGRKRKNPELTEEERALMRKEQNRESARLSRVRRKVIAAEYEGKLSELVNENSYLRKQVEGLNNRLAYLQSILTVTVKQQDENQ